MTQKQTEAQAPGRTLQYLYRFDFPDGSSKQFTITLDYDTLAIASAPPADQPSWTALDYHQCPNCPLDPASQQRCPIAAHMIDAVAFLKDWRSFDEVDTCVMARSRTYAKRTTLQEAASALLGIYMVASGCPILSKLRPMLATHLPFMDSDEVTYRTISMYLLAQYFLHRAGHSGDWDLHRLRVFLRECRDANAGYCDRLRSLGIRDAVLNALAVLNMQGELTSLTLETGDLARWDKIFLSHYERE